MSVFENRALSRISGPKRGEVTGEWRRLHNKELCGLHSSPNIVRVIKSRRLRWTGRVACMGREKVYTGLWYVNFREIHNLVDTGADGRIILKCVFKKWDRAWTGLIRLRIGTRGGLW
jgi:hypothetical protein